MTVYALNFRQNTSYVTDEANTDAYTYDTATGAYPITGSYFTYGPINNYQYDMRDRNSGNDARLAGVMFYTATGQPFRIDLPSGAGEYKLWLALGDASGSVSTGVDIRDGSSGSVLASISGTTTGNDFYDAAGSLLSAAAWPGSNAYITLTFSQSYMYLEPKTGGIRIAHIALESTAGGGSSSVPPPFPRFNYAILNH